MNNTFAFLTGLILLLFACGEKAPKTTDHTPPDLMERNVPLPPTETVEVTTPVSIETFWAQFQKKVIEKDAAAVAEMVTFPLTGAQFLIGKPAQHEGISQTQFIDNFIRVFDQGARDKISTTSYEELEEIQLNGAIYDLSQFDATGYRLLVQYDMEEETESTLMYIIGKKGNEFQLIGMEYAG